MKQKVIALLEPYRDKTLSFGCEVIVAGIAKDNPGCEHDVVVDDRKDEHGRIGMGYFGHVHPDDFQEIIGHPIKLNDWLAVLRERLDESRWHLKSDGRVMWEDHGVNFEKLKFNLATGQPATEADYKAFNEITSV